MNHEGLQRSLALNSFQRHLRPEFSKVYRLLRAKAGLVSGDQRHFRTNERFAFGLLLTLESLEVFDLNKRKRVNALPRKASAVVGLDDIFE
jgi:hypothetical protein